MFRSVKPIPDVAPARATLAIVGSYTGHNADAVESSSSCLGCFLYPLLGDLVSTGLPD